MGLLVETSTKHLDASSEVDVPPRSWSRLVGAAEQIAASLFPGQTVALRVTGDESIRRLNREFRAVDRPTDVLSFPANADAAGPGSEAADLHAGDIALSWETAQRQARSNGNSVEDECIALITHGLLHLAGFDHETDAEEARMQRRADELLAGLGLRLRVYGH
ncbi:rRNA maturation RNase YbeY [bacterium]|nr:rRNA maturation RNase YbeY [bacterium]